jgi:putative phosphoesterase
MKIGIISDTHGSLPSEVHRVFLGVEHIIHAGDIGNTDIITELETIAPVSAIYGNIDSWPIVSMYPLFQTVQLANYTIGIIHEIGSVRHFRYELFKKSMTPDIMIYGHTHIPAFERYQNILFINPGSASRPKTSRKGSVATLILVKDKLQCKPEFVEISRK